MDDTPYRQFFEQPAHANANLTRDEQSTEVMRFVEFWNSLTGQDPQWLYFDSKLTTYAELSRLNERGVSFATIRRRGSSVPSRSSSTGSSWRPADRLKSCRIGNCR